MKRLIPLLCLITLHSPDGGEVIVDTNHVVAIKPAEYAQGHIAPGIKAIIHATGHTFGVKETPEEVETYIKECGDN